LRSAISDRGGALGSRVALQLVAAGSSRAKASGRKLARAAGTRGARLGQDHDGRAGLSPVGEDVPSVNVIGATADDCREVMIEGASGILAICRDSERPQYFPAKRSLEWPSGCKTLIFSADEPERLRGKQCHKLWADELASWRYQQEAWDQCMFGLRLGASPQAVVTTTPKPTKLIRELKASPTTHLVTGSTYQNRANLATAYFSDIITRYEGTRLGRQELNAELLEDNPDVLWRLEQIDADRTEQAPELRRIVVAVDP
jgi:phage terminase large subunit-like protein